MKAEDETAAPEAVEAPGEALEPEAPAPRKTRRAAQSAEEVDAA